MKLTWKDKQEIQRIIKGFTEQDNERVQSEVERIVERSKSNPAENAMTVFLSQHYDFGLVEMAQDDVDAQEMAQTFVWDYVTMIVKWDMAVGVYRRRHGNMEAA
ncbi:hypothetical protein [Pantoea piersonii]|uniref:hypothetical protein n=1 Tax=Pantoea piersonii TaxID=2364647 RepID=UPI002898CA34|nr:hypothetical protein [Pantoea piersonii]